MLQASSAQPQLHQLHLGVHTCGEGTEVHELLDWTLSLPSLQHRDDPDLEPRPPGGGLSSSSPW